MWNTTNIVGTHHKKWLFATTRNQAACSGEWRSVLHPPSALPLHRVVFEPSYYRPPTRTLYRVVFKGLSLGGAYPEFSSGGHQAPLRPPSCGRFFNWGLFFLQSHSPRLASLRSHPNHFNAPLGHRPTLLGPAINTFNSTLFKRYDLLLFFWCGTLVLR